MSKHEVYCRECGCIFKLRKGKRGFFYGCSGFPICRETMSERDWALETDPPERVEFDDPANDDQ